MLKNPKFKRCFQVESVEENSIFILSERGYIELNNPLYQRLATLIDSQHTLDEIVEEILPDLLPEEASVNDTIRAGTKLYFTLMRMEEEGYIVESEDELPSSLAVFCDNLNINHQEAKRRLQKTQVAVSALSSISTSEFISTLESLQVEVSDDGDIEVVLTDDYLAVDLDAINQKHLQNNRPWILVKPVGTIVWIGPIFSPGKTGCWECLAQRLRGNKPIENFIQRHKNIATPVTIPLATCPSTMQTALGMAATEVFKWIVKGENKRLEGAIISHDTLSLETKKPHFGTAPPVSKLWKHS